MGKFHAMDKNEVDIQLHQIEMMVLVLLDGVEALYAKPDDPTMFQLPDTASNLLCFAAFDLDKRIKALKDELNSPDA
jgi:hypothetical protein